LNEIVHDKVTTIKSLENGFAFARREVKVKNSSKKLIP
jgi:hypothetical protein